MFAERWNAVNSRHQAAHFCGVVWKARSRFEQS